MWTSSFSSTTIEKMVLSPLKGLGTLTENFIWSYMRGFTSGLSLLFHRSACLSSCMHRYCSFTVHFEIKKCESSAFLPLLQGCFSYSHNPLRFHMNFGMDCSLSAQKCYWALDKDWNESADYLLSIDILTILSPNPWTQDVFSLIYVFFNFFSNIL